VSSILSVRNLTSPSLAQSAAVDLHLDDLQPSHENGFAADEVRAIMQAIYARGDRLMIGFLVSHMALALALAMYHGTWTATLLVGGGALGAFLLSAHLFPRTFFTRSFAGVAQQAFVALHIYQLYGQSEQHFWFFTAFTMMIVYQDWLCMWPGALLIIAQHLLFAGMHNAGMPVHFFPETYVGISKLFYHFGIALVQVSLCGYWAHLLRQQTLGDAWKKLQLTNGRRLLEDQVVRLRESESALQATGDALLESSRRQRTILDNSPDAMWIKDPLGRYSAVNSAFCAIVGQPAESIEGLTVVDLLPAEAAAVSRANETNVVASGARQTAELDFTLDGVTRVFETIITPIFDSRGEIAGTMGVARDVSERKRQEKESQEREVQMRDAQKLESLGLLAGGIAHDFNNLLVGILGNAELARDEIPVDSPAQKFVQQIEHAGLRAADLTRQMLAYAGKGRIAVEPVDMSSLVEEMAELLHSTVSKKAAFHLDLDRTLPAVEADATQLRQVVMNLITNASDALGESVGKITLRTTCRRLTRGDLSLPPGQHELDDGTYVVVEVSDTGTGMNAETMSRIFDPFFTTRFMGRGLGLAAVLGILRRHRGAIDIQSEPGRGSSFRVYLPASEGALAGSIGPKRASATAANTPRDRGIIIVVDDEPAVRQMAKHAIERAGFTVLTAADGLEALSILRAQDSRVSLVLLDSLMPRMNGTETLLELRKFRPELPVVLSSGYTEAVIDGSAHQDSLVAFLQKPYSPSTLISLIHEMLARVNRRDDQRRLA
jgi:two-component system cell cycle sensor histidine kinase/response regulator CckA